MGAANEAATRVLPRKSAFRFLERLPMMRVLDLLYRIAPGLGRWVVRNWYQYITRLDKNADMIFMNYGYADSAAANLVLHEHDEKDRFCIQLYHHVASALDLRNLDVLEVGCGRGGGASYIARYLGPGRMTGIDLADQAIAFCNRHYSVPNLDFQPGDAEALPFSDGSFDVVVNVESSHCYCSMPRFLTEVHRTLRPEGHVLIADRRERQGVDVLRKQFHEAGFDLVRETRITPNILRALELDDGRKMALIQRGVPALVRKTFKQFAATPGTSLYESFRTGAWEYVSFVLRKRNGALTSA